MTDYEGTYPFLYSPKAVRARIRIRVRKTQENSWELDGFEHSQILQYDLGGMLVFVKTKQLVASSTRLVSAYRQYLRQRRALRHKIVLINRRGRYYPLDFKKRGAHTNFARNPSFITSNVQNTRILE